MFILLLSLVIITTSLLQSSNAIPQVLAIYRLEYHDRPYSRWNHAVQENHAKGFHTGATYAPPTDLCSSYYPQLGPYSSKNKDILREHMNQLNSAGIQAIVVPFYLTTKEVNALHQHNALLAKNGERTIDKKITLLLTIALEFKIKVIFSLEDHRARNIIQIVNRVEYIYLKYARHGSVYKENNGDVVMFIANSHKINSVDLLEKLPKEGIQYFGSFDKDGKHALMSSFSGILIHVENEIKIAQEFATNTGMQSVIIISPGFNDLRLRPWALKDVVERNKGETYSNAWERAIEAKPSGVLINSFNDWCCSSQIEPASAVLDEDFICQSRTGCDKKSGMCAQMMKKLNIDPTYNTYSSSPSMYLELTAKYSAMFCTIGSNEATATTTQELIDDELIEIEVKAQ